MTKIKVQISAEKLKEKMDLQNGKDGEKGDKGDAGSPDTPEQIADKLNETTESVERSVIKGLEDALNSLRSRPLGRGYGASNPLGKYTGQTSITTVGTITTGVWQGTPISGTYISGADLTKTDDTNVTLTLGGTPVGSLLKAVSLTLGWTGTLADSRIASASTWNAKQDGSSILSALAGLTWSSGTPFVKMTGANTFALDTNTYLTSVTSHNLLSATHGDTTASSVARGDLVVGIGASPTWDNLSLGTVGKVLRSDGTDLVYSTLTIPDTTAINTILYSSAANVISALATAASGVLVTGAGAGVPSISTDIPTAVTIGGAYVYRVSGTDVAIADGGTGQSTKAAGFDALQPMSALGDTIYGGASGTGTRLAGQITTTRKFMRQTGDGVNSAAPAWDTVTATDVGLSNVENTALSTWAGTTNITTLGTIGTGTWSATAIALNKGGTGQTTKAAAFDALQPMTTLGDTIYGGASGTGTRLAGDTSNTRKFLRTLSVAGAAQAPAWDTILAADVPTLNQNTTGSAAKWTTARNLAGNSVDGSANVAFANKFVVQGTADTGLSGAQFLGSLGTGIVKNTTTTGVLSIAIAGDFPTLNQDTTGTAAHVTTNANLTGPVTSVGNATSVAALAITNAMIANTTIDLTAKVTGSLPVANGGTASATRKAASGQVANFGQLENHGTYTDFNLVQQWGGTYVQGDTNGVGDSQQHYQMMLSLGAQYDWGAANVYAMQMAIARNIANPYIWVRYKEGGDNTTGWGTWYKSSAGKADTLTTARTIGGNSFDGSANIALANKFIVQGTADAGLSGAQFMGALATGPVINTTTTGVFSIAGGGDTWPGVSASATKLATGRTIGGSAAFDGTANVTVATATGGFTVTGGTLKRTDNSAGNIDLDVENTNTGGNARFIASVGGSGAGDPEILFDIAGVSDWVMGADNSVTGDPFKISSGGSLGTNDYFVIDSSLSGQVFFPGMSTTASAANCFVNNATTPANEVLRSTSSIKYKTNVKDIIDSDADIIDRLRPISFTSLCGFDDPAVIHLGFIAEEVALIDERLVQWVNGQPDGVQYERIVVPLVKKVQQLQARIAVLEQKK